MRSACSSKVATCERTTGLSSASWISKTTNAWSEIGQSTAWNWQQGNRLQWIPGSDEEIIWNDRSDDGKRFVSRIYNTRTKATRTLPRAIYTISPDGKTALTHDFERMKHGGTNYVGIADENAEEWAPEGSYIWKMDIATGEHEPVLAVSDMVRRMYPATHSPEPEATLYFFREGFNPSGDRFIFFVKDAKPGARARTEGFSANLDGEDIRYLYKSPSHHFWIDDETIMDNGWHTPPGAAEELRGVFPIRRRWLRATEGIDLRGPERPYHPCPRTANGSSLTPTTWMALSICTCTTCHPSGSSR